MPDPLAVFALGAGLGLSLAAPPGPVATLSAERAIRVGYWPGVAVMLGATTGDGTHALLMAWGVMRLIGGSAWILALLTIAGGALMSVFAWQAWGTARRPLALGEEAARPKGRLARLPIGVGGFLAGYLIALTSPYNFGWWLGAGTGLFRDYGGAVFLGFFAAIIAWSLVWVALFVWARGRVKGLVRGVSYASAVVLALFALRLFWRGFGDVLALT